MRSWLISLGLIFFAIHNPNQPFLNWVFLPQLGLGLFVIAIFSIPLNKWKEISLGSKWVYIPLIVLLASISLSGVFQYFRGEVTLARGFAPTFSAFIWLALYALSRIEGEKIGKPIAYAVIIEAVSVLVAAFVSGGNRGGGIVSPTNYDIAVAFMVFGTFLSPKSWQWWLSSIAIIGILFTGAEEGLVVIAVMGLIVLLVKDYSIKTLLPLSVGILAGLAIVIVGLGQGLYVGSNGGQINNPGNPSTIGKFMALKSAIDVYPQQPEFNNYMDIATGYRWSTHWRIRPIQPFGYGYNMTEFYPGIPHNIILIIIEQVGLLGLAGWLVATFYVWRKSKRHYLWAGVLGLGMLDHFSFTQIAPWYFVMLGISEAYPLKSAAIFKESL